MDRSVAPGRTLAAEPSEPPDPAEGVGPPRSGRIVHELHRRDPLASLREVVAFRQVLEVLVRRELKSRYKRSALGFAWTMLNPLLMMLVTSVIFSSLFAFSIRNFSTYMLSAYVLWAFFAQGTTVANTCLQAGSALSRRIYLPPALFPLAAVGAAAVNLLLSLGPLGLLLLATGGHLSWALLALPLALALALLFTAGLALLLAAGSVFFHDLVHLYHVVLLAWMYLTPIFYPIEIVPEERRFVFWLNPMFHLTQVFRDPIYAGTWPDPLNLTVAAGWALGTAALGWWTFERARDAFAGYL